MRVIDAEDLCKRVKNKREEQLAADLKDMKFHLTDNLAFTTAIYDYIENNISDQYEEGGEGRNDKHGQHYVTTTEITNKVRSKFKATKSRVYEVLYLFEDILWWKTSSKNWVLNDDHLYINIDDE